MVVRLYRPRFQSRARWLLAIALLLPAAGFLQASGLNPISIAATLALVAASAALALDAGRPTVTVLRHGLMVRNGLGRRPDALGWTEVVRADHTPGILTLTTSAKNRYQLYVDDRAADFITRMVERKLTAKDL